jgi:tetratricopeptide (TPR) repeat protein
MIKPLVVLALALLPLGLFAQDARLAREYFSNGEYEKAADIYKELHEKDKGNDYYFERYLTTLFEIERYEEAERIIKRALKNYPDKIERYVDYGNLYAKQNQKDKANEQYDKAVKALTANQVQIIKLSNAFLNLRLFDFALATYERGAKLLKEPYMFAFEMGNIYREKGETAKMIDAYLNSLEYMPNRLTNVQAFFQSHLPPTGGYDELKKQLYQRIQKQPEQTIYPELLIWIFIQEGDFSSAFRQARALDERLAENGTRIFRLAQTAVREKAYDAGIEAYQYIIQRKGVASPYYIESRQRVLAAQRDRLAEGKLVFQREDLLKLEAEYLDFLKEFGRNQSTSIIMQELADFQAFYLHELNKAIALLEEALKIPNLPRLSKAEIKLSLGDFYLMKGEVWESTLLYSQVDKEMQDAPLGEVARFKNAKLSYYKGEFEWAQEQLDVLKGSTSEFISNDALDLSVFIMDNYALDTTPATMYLFAKADLLLFQKRYTEAFSTLDSIASLYKDHPLQDDVLFTKAKVYLQQNQAEKALPLLQQITEQYKDGILMDNALYEMALIYEEKLKQPDKAMELYLKIITDHSGSSLVTDARKRFRKLRGDGV